LLWLAHSLELAPSQADDLHQAARSNICNWYAHVPHQLRALLPHHGPVYAVAFSPDGRLVLTGGKGGTARFWEAATGKALGQPLENGDTVYAVAFSPDGRTVLTAGRDRTARLWDMATGQAAGGPLPHPDLVHAVAFSPDGGTILTGCEDGKAR